MKPFLSLLPLMCLGCGSTDDSELGNSGVPMFEKPIMELTAAEREKLCTALNDTYEEQGPTLREFCTLVAVANNQCTSENVDQCVGEARIVETMACPIAEGPSETCSVLASDVAQCLLDRLYPFEEPISCDTDFVAANQPCSGEIEDECPGLLPGARRLEWPDVD